MLKKLIYNIYTHLEANFALAQHHYLRSTDGLAFAAMLVEMHKTRGLKYEVDLFITQVVLQYVYLTNPIKINININFFILEGCVCVIYQWHSQHFNHILSYILL